MSHSASASASFGSSSRIGSVFSASADAEIARLKSIASALAAPLVGLGVERDQCCFDAATQDVRLGSGEFLSRAAVQSMLKEVNHAINATVMRLGVALEDHFVRFFDHLKRRNEDELALWMPQPDAVTPASTVLLRTAPPQPAKTKATSAQLAPAVDALSNWLAVALEAVMTSTHATKGAVYLRSADSSGYLRQAYGVPLNNDLPKDVALASGTTIGVVVQTAVGANLSKSRVDSAREAEAQGFAAHTSATPFKVQTAIVMPIVPPGSSVAIGCVVVADKNEPGIEAFTLADEHRVWGLCTEAEGVFARYPYTHLLSYSVSRDFVSALRAASQLVPVYEKLDVDPIKVQGNILPTRQGKALMLRQGTAVMAQLVKDTHTDNPKLVAGSTTVPVGFNDEDVLESVAPYLRNLEMLWHSSLESVMKLRGECAKWESKVGEKEAVILDMEVQIKNIAKALHKTKADVRRIRKVVPQHLKEALGAESPGPDGNFQQSYASLDNAVTVKGGGMSSSSVIAVLPPIPSSGSPATARSHGAINSNTIPASALTGRGAAAAAAGGKGGSRGGVGAGSVTGLLPAPPATARK